MLRGKSRAALEGLLAPYACAGLFVGSRFQSGCLLRLGACAPACFLLAKWLGLAASRLPASVEARMHSALCSVLYMHMWEIHCLRGREQGKRCRLVHVLVCRKKPKMALERVATTEF